MGDLSNIIPQETPTVEAIYAHYKAKGEADEPRAYLGASIIGHECDRYLWYVFRDCVRESFDGRMIRLFDTGQHAEARFVSDLRAIGVTVNDFDDNGNQFEGRALGGHFRYHMDGCAVGVLEAPKTWHVLEFKTHSNKSFNDLRNKGVLSAKPQHYAQVQAEMSDTGMTRALYLAVNKDTDELFSERIRHDPAFCKTLWARAERVITSTSILTRCASKNDDFRCRFCPAQDLCWNVGWDKALPAFPSPVISCRQCCHATAELDGEHGRWTCAKHKIDLTRDHQLRACPDHLLLPDLVFFAIVNDATESSIEFKNNSDGAIWVHGKGEGQYSTLELMKLPAPLVGNNALTKLKKEMGSSVVDVPFGEGMGMLVNQYPPESSRRLWDGPVRDENAAVDVLSRLMRLQDGEDFPEPTRHEETDETEAYEYASKYLLVIYKQHGHMAVWQSVM